MPSTPFSCSIIRDWHIKFGQLTIYAVLKDKKTVSYSHYVHVGYRTINKNVYYSYISETLNLFEHNPQLVCIAALVAIFTNIRCRIVIGRRAKFVDGPAK